MAARYVVEHLNHLGIVAEVCREIGVAAWLDGHDPCVGYLRRKLSIEIGNYPFLYSYFLAKCLESA